MNLQEVKRGDDDSVIASDLAELCRCDDDAHIASKVVGIQLDRLLSLVNQFPPGSDGRKALSILGDMMLQDSHTLQTRESVIDVIAGHRHPKVVSEAEVERDAIEGWLE